MNKKKEVIETPVIDEYNLNTQVNDLGGSLAWSVIKNQFENQKRDEIKLKIEEACKTQKEEDDVFKFFYTAFTGLLVLFGLVFFYYVATSSWRDTKAKEEMYYKACSQGDVAGCLAGVHVKGGSFSGNGNVRLYRSLYFAKTGKQLPLLDGEEYQAQHAKDNEFNGWKVQKQDEKEILITKDNDTIEVYIKKPN